jgi:hypothetical protein
MMKKKKLKVLSDPAGELLDAQTALDAMRQNLKLATQDIAKKGLMVQTVICDSHGKPVKVQRINPSIKIQREALRTIGVLKKQIEGLQKEVAASEKPLTALDILAQMKKEKEAHESD